MNLNVLSSTKHFIDLIADFCKYPRKFTIFLNPRKLLSTKGIHSTLWKLNSTARSECNGHLNWILVFLCSNCWNSSQNILAIGWKDTKVKKKHYFNNVNFFIHKSLYVWFYLMKNHAINLDRILQYKCTTFYDPNSFKLVSLWCRLLHTEVYHHSFRLTYLVPVEYLDILRIHYFINVCYFNDIIELCN